MEVSLFGNTSFEKNGILDNILHKYSLQMTLKMYIYKIYALIIIYLKT